MKKILLLAAILLTVIASNNISAQKLKKETVNKINSSPSLTVLPCSVDTADNPTPPNNAVNINPMGTTLYWVNGEGTVNVEIWFGDSTSVSKVYDGYKITTWATGWLQISTDYSWYIVCKNDTCSTTGPVWRFTTRPDYNYGTVDVYPQYNTFWTGNTNGNSKSDGEINTVYPNTAWAVFDISSFSIYPAINSAYFHGYVNAANWPYWSATPMGSVNPLTDAASSIKNQILANYDQSQAYIYSDEASSFTTGWHIYPMGNTVLQDLNAAISSGQTWFAVGFVDRDFSASYYINYDGWTQPNPPYLELTYDLCLSCPPFAPVNLTAQEVLNPNPQVLLNWVIRSNSWGVHIYRKNGNPGDPGQFYLIGTAADSIVHYFDSTVVTDSTYTYGLKAYNVYGNSDFSNYATITIDALPVELVSFFAEAYDGNVLLEWQTATEMNNRGFDVEKQVHSLQSSVGKWEMIGFVEGSGTSLEAHSYTFTDKNLVPGKYSYRLKQIDFDGTYKYSNTVDVDITAPNTFALEQNYPNPFNPSTVIKYSVPVSGFVTLKVYDLLGQEVATLVNENKDAGIYNVEFDASSLSTGVYLYKLTAGSFTDTKKLMLLK